MIKTKLTGWGYYPSSMSYVTRPERSLQLKTNREMKSIARGLGRSYGDASLNHDQEVVLMERLNRFLSLDAVEGLLRAEAGTSLEEILKVIVPRGWFLPVVPGTQHVTLGGCFAADIHGKNHHTDGSFSQYVREIELLLANGARRKCSPVREPELFWATAGGMGLTGYITEMTLKLLPISSAYMMVTHRPAKNYDEIFELLNDPHLDDKYSVAWIDCLASGENFGRSILMTGRHADASELPSKVKKPLTLTAIPKRRVPCFFPSKVLNAWTVKAFNQAYYWSQARKTAPFIADFERYFFPLDALDGWNKIYGKRGFIQYQAVIPPSRAHEGFKELLKQLTAAKRVAFLAVFKRFGREGSGYLSFPREGMTLALDIPVSDPGLFPFLDELDKLLLEFGGRLYLAKDARMKPETFHRMYPRLAEWQKVKAQVDPYQTFSSDLSRRLKMENQ